MKKNEVFGKTEQYGACRFCGQTNMVMADEELTPPQLEEEATLACTCDEAVEYAAEVTRERRVKEKIRKLCGESEGKGRNVTEETQNALEMLAGEICKKEHQGSDHNGQNRGQTGSKNDGERQGEGGQRKKEFREL